MDLENRLENVLAEHQSEIRKWDRVMDHGGFYGKLENILCLAACRREYIGWQDCRQLTRDFREGLE